MLHGPLLRQSIDEIHLLELLLQIQILFREQSLWKLKRTGSLAVHTLIRTNADLGIICMERTTIKRATVNQFESRYVDNIHSAVAMKWTLKRRKQRSGRAKRQLYTVGHEITLSLHNPRSRVRIM